MKNRMLRGQPAPTGFAASVSGWLRTYVYQQRSVGGGVTINQRVRLDLLDSCASLPVGVGDDDPRIRMLALASPGNRWEPGQQQLAVIHSAGQVIPGNDTPPVKPEALLNALAHAAALDVAVVHAQEISRVKKGTEAAPTHEATLAYERTRGDEAEAALRQARDSLEHVKTDYLRERDERRRLQAIVMDREPVVATETVAAPRALPKNVRRRGDRFQGYLKRDGETISQTFDTPEEAAGWVREQQNQIAREKAAHDANGPGPHYEPDISPEDRAAMQERAAA